MSKFWISGHLSYYLLIVKSLTCSTLINISYVIAVLHWLVKTGTKTSMHHRWMLSSDHQPPISYSWVAWEICLLQKKMRP